MMIVYEGNGEVLVFESSVEHEMLQEWFVEGGRDLDEYERYVMERSVAILSEIRVNTCTRVAV